MKRLCNFIKNCVLVLLSLIVFTGAFGLSYRAHYCGGHLSGIAFYTELGIQEPVSCGCTDNESGEHSGWPTNLDKKSCCKDESFYNRLSPEYSQNHSSAQTFQLFSETDINISLSSFPLSESTIVTNYYLRPPPLAGRRLVLFLSQQRIPSEIYS